MKVIVTGAGGPAGIGVIRALRRGGWEVLAVDSDPLAAGLHLADEGVVVPRADAPGFVEALVGVAVEAGAEVLCSTVAEELVGLTRERSRLDAAGLSSWLPSPSAVVRCVDKWRFAACMDGWGVPAPATALGGSGGVAPPWIVKPRFGRGSRDVVAASTIEDLAFALRTVPDPIVQARVDGREFTADALVDRGRRRVAVVPRWRLETKAGISTKGTTFQDDEVERVVAAALAAVALEGPANVQGFVRPDGSVQVIEVNPRFSGGLPLSLAAGADMVGEYVRVALGHPLDPERLRFRAGVTMLRHLEEIFVDAPVAEPGLVGAP